MTQPARVRLGVIGAGAYMNAHMEACRKLHGLRGVSGAFGRLQALDPGPPYPLPYEQFVSAIRGGEPVRSTFEAGVKAAEFVDAAHASANESRWATL